MSNFKIEELIEAKKYYINKWLNGLIKKRNRRAYIAANAIGKQIPTKVICEKPFRARCPTCLRVVEDYKEVNGGRSFRLCVPDICPFCGQKLDV